MNYPLAFLTYCTSLELKLTSLRKEVLHILWSEQKPLKAYEILDCLLKIKQNATPPTVYRALLFFVSRGVVHKIESIQSYTLCCEPEKHLSSELLMVCNICHNVVEVYDADLCVLLESLAKNHQFQLKHDTIEIKGICKKCL